MKKIAVERKDYVGAIELRQHAHVGTEGILSSELLFLTQKRLINAPAQGRQNLFQLSAQAFARGRMRLADQKRKAVALLCEECVAKVPNVGIKRCAIALFSFVNKPLRASWIIKIENRCLDESVRCAPACRVQRISLQLDRASIHGRCDERNRTGTPGHRGCVIQKFPRDCPLHTLRKWNQMCFRSSATVQAKTSQRHRRAH